MKPSCYINTKAHEKTDFKVPVTQAEFRILSDVEIEKLDVKEDSIKIRSLFKEAGYQKEYEDTADTKVTQKSLLLSDFEKEHGEFDKHERGTKEFKRLKRK